MNMVTALCAGKLSFALGVVVRLLRVEQSIQELRNSSIAAAPTLHLDKDKPRPPNHGQP